MFNIKDYLEKFQNITPPDDDIKKKIIEIISDIFKTKIEKEQIIIRNNTIYIKTNPVLKNEIFIKKIFILNKLTECFGKKTPKNIL